MQYNYKTISQRLDIIDPQISEIIDYIERHFNSIEEKSSEELRFEVNGSFVLDFIHTEDQGKVVIRSNSRKFLETEIEILRQNKTGILAIIRDTVKNAG